MYFVFDKLRLSTIFQLSDSCKMVNVSKMQSAEQRSQFLKLLNKATLSYFYLVELFWTSP